MWTPRTIWLLLWNILNRSLREEWYIWICVHIYSNLQSDEAPIQSIQWRKSHNISNKIMEPWKCTITNLSTLPIMGIWWGLILICIRDKCVSLSSWSPSPIFQSSHCNSFDDPAPLNCHLPEVSIYWRTIILWTAVVLSIGHVIPIVIPEMGFRVTCTIIYLSSWVLLFTIIWHCR